MPLWNLLSTQIGETMQPVKRL